MDINKLEQQKRFNKQLISNLEEQIKVYEEFKRYYYQRCDVNRKEDASVTVNFHAYNKNKDRIRKLKKELQSLVEVQKQLKQEIAYRYAEERYMNAVADTWFSQSVISTKSVTYES